MSNNQDHAKVANFRTAVGNVETELRGTVGEAGGIASFQIYSAILSNWAQPRQIAAG